MNTQLLDPMDKLKATIKTDYKAVAHGVFNMMLESDPDDLACMVYGMLPAKWMGLVEGQLKEKFERMIKPVRDFYIELWTNEMPDAETLSKDIKRCNDFVLDYTRDGLREISGHLLHIACEKGICKA